MIVELTYNNGRHIATFELETKSISKIKKILQEQFDKENPLRFYCDIKGCGCNFSTDKILEIHRENHFKQSKPVSVNTHAVEKELLEISNDSDLYQCKLKSGKIGCSHGLKDKCTHYCHERYTVIGENNHG